MSKIGQSVKGSCMIVTFYIITTKPSPFRCVTFLKIPTMMCEVMTLRDKQD